MRGTGLYLCIESTAIKKECVNSRQETLSDTGPLLPFICPLLLGSLSVISWSSKKSLLTFLKKNVSFWLSCFNRNMWNENMEVMSFPFWDLDIVRFSVITQKREMLVTPPPFPPAPPTPCCTFYLFSFLLSSVLSFSGGILNEWAGWKALSRWHKKR